MTYKTSKRLELFGALALLLFALCWLMAWALLQWAPASWVKLFVSWQAQPAIAVAWVCLVVLPALGLLLDRFFRVWRQSRLSWRRFNGPVWGRLTAALTLVFLCFHAAVLGYLNLAALSGDRLFLEIVQWQQIWGGELFLRVGLFATLCQSFERLYHNALDRGVFVTVGQQLLARRFEMAFVGLTGVVLATL